MCRIANISATTRATLANLMPPKAGAAQVEPVEGAGYEGVLSLRAATNADFTIRPNADFQ